MKGLIIKDLNSYKKEMTYTFIIVTVFLIVNVFLHFFTSENSYLIDLPIAFSGFIVVGFAYSDEVNHWTRYSVSLPYSRGQLVSSKYLLTLIIILVTLCLSFISNRFAQMYADVRIGIEVTRKIFSTNIFEISPLLVRLTASLIFPSIGLPIIFKKGEKGKTGYTIAAAGIPIYVMNGGNIAAKLTFLCVEHPIILLLIFLVGAIIFASSWLLSVHFFKKREF